MKLTDMKLGLRMGLGFTLVIALLGAAIVYGLVSLGTLGVIQDEGAKRTRDLRATEELNQSVGEMYGMVADVIINKNYDATDREWRVDTASMDRQLENMKKVVDTDAEIASLAKVQKDLREYRTNLEALFTLFRNGASVDDKRVKELDERIDVTRGAVLNELEGITESIAAEVDQADQHFDNIRKSVTDFSTGLFIVAVLFGAAVALFITKSIVGPVQQGVAFAEALAKGDLTAKIELVQKDEIGQLAQALRNMVEQLSRVVEEVQAASDNVASGSQQLSSSSQEMSHGATEQAASIEEISSSIEEMTANIQQNTDNARQTEHLARQSAKDAEEGGFAVQETARAMKEIANKITIIEEIARQTNLLALNAAIEAARAGEAGKGFAVVASEVRKLAERAQAAAAQISSLSSVSVEVAERAGEMISKIVPDIQRTSELVQEVAAAGVEQSTGTFQVNKAVQQLDTVVQQNASAAEEMASTAEELSAQAEQLQDSISFFKLENHAGIAKRSAKPAFARQSAPAPKTRRALTSDHDGDLEFESY